ncbi:DNA recombination protein RmuC [Clostridia bacterium]|nr:DNA recombination protein RmuC [Clostridia bacterium]
MDRWMLAGLSLIAGFILGSLVMRFLLKDTSKRYLQNELLKKERKEEEQENRIYGLGAELARVKVELLESTRQLEEKERFFKESLYLMEDRFKSLSADVLEKTNERFLQIAKEELSSQRKDGDRSLEKKTLEIDAMLTPMKESLKQVSQLMQDLEKDRIESQAQVMSRMFEVNTAQNELKKETAQLVRALRTPQVRGRWGEVQLKRVVELAGMLDHCDFEEQVSVTTENGRLRPDLKIFLPGGKTVVVDAKTPLLAYLDAVEADDPDVREKKLKEHAAQVKKHISQLSQKSYWQQFEDTPEFVVMFLPGEPFFSAALEKDPNLIEYGMDQQVILATPTTLIALLKSVAYGWQQEVISQNAREISVLGRELYDRIRVFAGHFGELEKGLNRSVTAYNKAVQSFDKRILPSARRFENYGIKPKKELEPQNIIEKIATPHEAKYLD